MCSPPGSSVYGILQAGILEGVPFPTPGDLPDPGIEPMSLVSLALSLAGRFFTTSATWEAQYHLYVEFKKCNKLVNITERSKLMDVENTPAVTSGRGGPV